MSQDDLVREFQVLRDLTHRNVLPRAGPLQLVGETLEQVPRGFDDVLAGDPDGLRQHQEDEEAGRLVHLHGATGQVSDLVT